MENRSGRHRIRCCGRRSFGMRRCRMRSRRKQSYAGRRCGDGRYVESHRRRHRRRGYSKRSYSTGKEKVKIPPPPPPLPLSQPEAILVEQDDEQNTKKTKVFVNTITRGRSSLLFSTPSLPVLFAAARIRESSHSAEQRTQKQIPSHDS